MNDTSYLNNTVLGFYQLFSAISLRDIIVNIIKIIVFSVVYAFIMSKVFKKPKYHLPYHKAIIGSSFLVSVILYFIDVYFFTPVFRPVVSLLIKFVAIIIIAICLCLVEWFMFATKSENDKVLKKILTVQTVCWFVLEVIYKIIISMIFAGIAFFLT